MSATDALRAPRGQLFLRRDSLVPPARAEGQLRPGVPVDSTENRSRPSYFRRGTFQTSTADLAAPYACLVVGRESGALWLVVLGPFFAMLAIVSVVCFARVSSGMGRVFRASDPGHQTRRRAEAGARA